MINTETDVIIRKHFASNVFFRILFEKANDAHLIIDPLTSRIILFNESAYKRLGYTKEEFRKLSISDIDIYENHEASRLHLEKMLQRGEDNFHTKHKTKDGRILDVEVLAKVVEFENNKFIFGIWRDITEIKENIKEKEELIKELKKSLEEVEKLREILPVCTYCKKISVGNEQWETLEEYMHKKTKYDFSHGICPECLNKKFPDYAPKNDK